MNNIEILEKLKDEQYDKETLKTICEFYDEEFKPYVLSTEEREAIENLIKENKELKEKLEEKDMQHELELIGKEEYTKDAMGEIIEHYYTANEDCIPKSKVKAKIEELDKRKRIKSQIKYSTIDELIFDKKIETLQELLEEGE